MILERDDLSPRNLALILGGCALLVAAAYFYPQAAAHYKRWKQRGTFDQISNFAAQHDRANTLLAIESALSREPGNPRAWRMAADYLEQSGNPEAVRMREQVVRIEPSALDNHLALARTAIRFMALPTAQEALDGVADSERHTDDYLKTAAALATASGRPGEAAALLAAVLRHTPGDLQSRLERARITLRYAPPGPAAAALGELQVLAEMPATQVIATRELASHALRKKDYASAQGYTSQLTNRADAELVDLILLANIQLGVGDGLKTILPPLQTYALAHPDALPELTGWLVAINQAEAALAWLQTLPASVQSLPEAITAKADCLVALRRWEEAGALIAQGAWGPVSSKSILLAVSARVLGDVDRVRIKRDVWEEAVRLSETDLNGLRVLYRLALTWDWGPESNTVLLAIARKFPAQSWVFQTLVVRYQRGKDTIGLRNLYGIWHEGQPDNALVEGNWAFLTLLTSPSRLPNPAKASAEKLNQADPGNPFFATTQAFAVWQLGRAKEALALMQKLPAAQLNTPGRALYLALFLNDCHRRKEAEVALALCNKTTLFPEELQLFLTLSSSSSPVLENL
jgi:Tfp pilus assembly protein PilF